MNFNNHISPRNLFLSGIFLLAASLPLSKFAMSVSQMILLAAWLWEGNLKHKIQTFFSDKTGLVLSGVFVMHLIGLVHTSDFGYAFNDLKVKVPLLILPLLLATGPRSTPREFNAVLSVFLGAVVLGTLISTAALAGLINQPLKEIRNISFLISHIRFSLMICMAFFICCYFLMNKSGITTLRRFVLLVLITWLVLFLLLLESVTGVSVLLVTGFFLLLQYTWKKKQGIIKFSLFVCLAVIPAGIYYIIGREVREFYTIKPVDFSQLDTITAEGNSYQHFSDAKNTENGNLIWVYICWEEMEKEWNRVSPIRFDERDRKGNEIRYTLVRFLASKGERKDGAAVKLLTEEEIRSIENGIANARYQGLFNLRGRIHQIIWEYDNYITTRNPSGHSAMQRVEYWRTGWHIFKDQPWAGVGTGDVQQAYDEEYEMLNSPLEKKWRLRAHNQYLTMFITFGVFGGVFFLFSLIAPWIFEKNIRGDYLYIAFLVISLTSMIAEDTLESQAGVTFFVFFNSLLLFRENYFIFLKR